MTHPLKARYAWWRGREALAHRKWRAAVKKFKSDDPRRKNAYHAWQNAHDRLVGVQRLVARQSQVVVGVSTALVEKIQLFEGGSKGGLFWPYYDRAGMKWTQGYGHTQGVTARSKPWTTEEAGRVLKRDLDLSYWPAAAKALKHYGIPITQGRADALTDFAYNLGPGWFYKGTMGAAMASRDAGRIAKAILIYDHDAHGVTQPGLVARRTWESHRYLQS